MSCEKQQLASTFFGANGQSFRRQSRMVVLSNLLLLGEFPDIRHSLIGLLPACYTLRFSFFNFHFFQEDRRKESGVRSQNIVRLYLLSGLVHTRVSTNGLPPSLFGLSARRTARNAILDSLPQTAGTFRRLKKNIGAAVYLWHTGKFDVLHVNPPLVRFVVGAPIALFCKMSIILASSSPGSDRTHSKDHLGRHPQVYRQTQLHDNEVSILLPSTEQRACSGPRNSLVSAKYYRSPA